MTRSEQLFARAVQRIPGGVNSPVRAFPAVGGHPRFIARGDGAYLFDVDGRKYVDFIGSWGPMLLGHNHPVVREAVMRAAQDGLSFGAATEREVEMAELICEIIPSVEMVRMVNSGTEAVMSAVRAARGYTGRDKVIKFAGCYHGHSDAMLVKAGSGVLTAGVPDSSGVPAGCACDTLTAAYNDLASVERLMAQNEGNIAAVIVEPVAANMGVIPPERDFLRGLRRLCDQAGAVLIFDEVITGFRFSLTGAQGCYGVTPDLTTFGKIIGAGMPVGAYGGKRAIMETIAPVGPVYQAGTLSGNPIAMAAGLALLRLLREDSGVYDRLAKKAGRFCSGARALFAEYQIPAQITCVGSLACIFFTEHPVRNYEDAKTSDTAAFSRYFKEMLEHGFLFAPSQFEAIFFSDAHTDAQIDAALRVMQQYLERIQK